jgi:ribosome-associated translation inhibitor RaiA
MKQPLQIIWRGMETSPALDANIRERVEKLESFCDRIIGCRVVVDREHRKDHTHEDAFVAARDAFDAMRRQLEDFVRREHETHPRC